MKTATAPWYKTLFERDYYDFFYKSALSGQLDEEQRERMTDGQVDFIVSALGLAPGARVLDLCCGHGRHAVRLARRGMIVTGLDLSTYHIRLARAAARDAGVRARWLRADMREIPRGAGPFDAVINMFTAFGYFDDEAENQRVLDGVARALGPGGRFLIDTMHRDGLMARFQERDWHDGPDGGLMLERRAFDSRTGRSHADWLYIEADGTRHQQSHSVRIYTHGELAVMLERAGLAIRDAWGDFDASPLGMHSRRLIVLAQKPA